MNPVTHLDRDRLSDILTRTAHPEGGSHVLMYGPRGTGKTTSAVRSAQPGQKVVSVTLNSEGSAASLWGHYVPKGGTFEWNYGPAAQAWQSGALLIINELDHASEDVSNLLHVVLDDVEVASVTLPTGETITPQPGFRAIASMNGRLQDVAPAVLDRFALKIPVLAPSKEMINTLPKDLRNTCRFLYKEAAEKDISVDWEPDFTFCQLLHLSDLRFAEGLSDMERAELVTGSKESADRLVDTLARFQGLSGTMERALG